MKWLLPVVFGIAAISLSNESGIVSAQDAAPAPTLSSLKLDFDVRRAELLKPQLELQKKYEEQLNRLMDQVTQAGDLEKALAVKTELEGYRQSESKPAGDDFPELQRLQEIYAQSTAEREDALNKKLKLLIEGYIAQLVPLQKRLTQEKKLEEALKAKEEVAKVNALALALAAGNSKSSPNRRGASDEPFRNSLGMEFVPVAISGASAGEEKILFSVWETRVSDYRAFIRRKNLQWPSPDFKQADDHPAVMVSWDDAKAFCQWLTEKERMAGTIEKSSQYRLPTDHEWSCAAGLGKVEDPALTPVEKTRKIQDHFPWEKEWPPPKGAGNFYGEETVEDPVSGRKTIPGYDDGFSKTSPAGIYPSNRFGLYDIGGNVWEWCEDWFDPASMKLRVLRGGSWINGDAPSLLTSHRVRNSPATRNPNNGFRCVLVVVGN